MENQITLEYYNIRILLFNPINLNYNVAPNLIQPIMHHDFYDDTDTSASITPYALSDIESDSEYKSFDDTQQITK